MLREETNSSGVFGGAFWSEAFALLASLFLLVACTPTPDPITADTGDDTSSSDSSDSSESDSTETDSRAEFQVSFTNDVGKLTSPSAPNDVYLGQSIAVGDWNGDGTNDVAIGIPLYDRVTTDTGGVLIYYGGFSGSTESTWDLRLTAPNTNSNQFGYSALSADVNGDGVDDLIVGSPFEDPSDRGAVYVFSGSTSGISTTPSQTLSEPNGSASAGFGTSLARGDMDGDGNPELLVGAWANDTEATNAGAAWVIQGAASGNYSIASAVEITLGTGVASDYFGWSVGLGDYNGDTTLDVFVGAPRIEGGGTDRGAVYIYEGNGTQGTWVTSTTVPAVTMSNPVGNNSDYFGESMVFADIDNDGNQDLIVGAPRADYSGTDQGLGIVYSNIASDQSTYDYLVLGNTTTLTSNYFGSGMTVGDVNNDGQLDLLVGSPTYEQQGYNSGRVDVYHGSSTGLWDIATEDLVFEMGNQTDGTYLSNYDYFGWALCAGDFNADTRTDLIVGAYYDDVKYSNDGAVYAYYATSNGNIYNTPDTTMVPVSLISTQRGHGSSCVVFDYNNDGFDDLLIGAQDDDTVGTNSGAVYIYYGASPGISVVPGSVIYDPGDNNSNAFGSSLSYGDLNNDGFDDLVVGAYLDDTGGTDRGVVYVFESDNTSGVIDTTSSTVFQDVNANTDYYGYSTLVYDYDGDGDQDLLVGVPLSNVPATDSGRVEVYLNPGTTNTLLDTTTDAAITHPTSLISSSFGSALAAGIYSNSSFQDLFIGSEADDTFYTNGGAVYVYEGSVSGPSATPTNTISGLAGTDSTSDYLGNSIVVFDFDQDGTNDLMIGSYRDGDGGVDAGSVYILR